MIDNEVEEPEFTDDQLRAALKQVGIEARKEAFAAGLPIFFARNGSIIALYSDGSEKVIKRVNEESSTQRDT